MEIFVIIKCFTWIIKMRKFDHPGPAISYSNPEQSRTAKGLQISMCTEHLVYLRIKQRGVRMKSIIYQLFTNN
jgi:hypothetical protein